VTVGWVENRSTSGNMISIAKLALRELVVRDEAA
jgi:hypothetical protein